MNNKIGVVTVTYNSGDVLEGFMDSINKQTHDDFIVYVIDNNSSDDTASKINAFNSKKVVYIQNEENFGVAKANNQGIQKAFEDNCDFILLLNNDTVFTGNTFEKLLKGLKENHADIVVPKMYYFDEQDRIWYAGGNFDNTFHCNVDHKGIKQKDIGQYNEIAKITYAPTCCMLIQKSVIVDVGLMDEKYFVYVDDVDFCYRATILNGKKMLYLPDFEFYHKVGGLTNKGGSSKKSDFAIIYSTRNKVYMCKKFVGVKKIIYLIWFLIYENLRILLNKRYRRSFHTLYIFNKSYLLGIFYK